MVPKLYAVGDIHGRADLLRRALKWIETDAQGEPTHIVFVGDYIDRGPDSQDVLDIMMAGPNTTRNSYTCLRGNHEQLCLDAERSRSDMDDWLSNGGNIALKSFGGKIPEKYMNWMGKLRLYYEDDKRIFVHAGMSQGIPIAEQEADVLLWIREPFLLVDHDFGKHVVHGHTPIGPEMLKSRTNLDAGSYDTGWLCVAAFDAIETGAPSRAVKIGIKQNRKVK